MTPLDVAANELIAAMAELFEQLALEVALHALSSVAGFGWTGGNPQDHLEGCDRGLQASAGDT